MEKNNQPKNSSLSQKLSHSISHRTDDVLSKKWSQPRVVYSEFDRYPDPGIDCSNDPGVTDQSGGPDSDINNIVARFHKTGILPNVNVDLVFADVSDAPSYQDALQIVINAENQFMSLDAKTRKKFDNSPAQFLEWIENPENAREVASMGLGTLVDNTPSPASPSPADGQAAPSNAKSKSQPAPKGDES